MNTSQKSVWFFLIILLSGLVVGSLIGNLTSDISYLSWLSYGKTFGLTSPLVLNLDIIVLQFALTMRFTISGILGMILSILIYKKLL